jgi:hypothetical protein
VRFELKLRQGVDARGERRARNRAKVLRIHRCTADLFHRYGSRRRDRIDHDAFERALPQLADQQADEEFLLVSSCAREQRLQRRCPPGRRARAS